MDEAAVTTTPIATTIKEYILDEFLPGVDPSELTETTPLVSGGILDSLATVKMITFLEERYGIEIQAHETSLDHMDSIQSITRLIQSKL